MRLKVKNIQKLRPFDPIEIHVPIGTSTSFYKYRRYENGAWYRSEDDGKTFGAGASGVELALIIQLLILWEKMGAR